MPDGHSTIFEQRTKNMSDQDFRGRMLSAIADLRCPTERVEDKIERVEGRIEQVYR